MPITHDRFKASKWGWKKKLAKVLLDCIEWTDYEVLVTEAGKWPWKFWLTKWEPLARRSWHRKLFPWRIRCAWEGVLRKWIFGGCTKCAKKFTLTELLARDGKIQYHQSGSACHADCEPTDEFVAMVRAMHANDEAIRREIARYRECQ